MSKVRPVVLALALLCVRCDAEVSEAPPTLSVVVGVEAKCSDLVRKVALHVTADGDSTELFDRKIASSSDLPVTTSVTIGEGVHTLTAQFTTSDGEELKQSSLSVRVPGGVAGRMAMVLPCACQGVLCPAGETCDEVPPRSGQAKCLGVKACGNGVCEEGENANGCPSDCAPLCGDKVCSEGESCTSCPGDCDPCGAAGSGGVGSGGAGASGGKAGSGNQGGTSGGGKGGQGGMSGISGQSGQSGAGMSGGGGASGAGQAGAGSGAGAGGAGAGGAPCTPKSCEAYGSEACGSANDGCGNKLECGPCPSGQTCGASKANVCGGQVQCDPIQGTGCPPQRPKCQVFLNALDCVVPGSGMDGDTCSQMGDGDSCASGYACITAAGDPCATGGSCDPSSTRCQRLCNESNACPAGYACLLGLQQTPPEVAGLKACVRECDALKQNCPVGEGCYYAGAGDVCFVAGSSPRGSSCTKGNDCMVGDMCAGNICRKVCDPKAPKCGGGKCVMVAGVSYGACL